MTLGRRAFIAVATAALLGLGLSGPDRDEGRRLTDPTTVALDFDNRTISEVVKAIEGRSGKRVLAVGTVPAKSAVGPFGFMAPVDTSWFSRTVTLQSPGPVPFWEAIDRLAEAGRLTYRVASGGGNGGESTCVVFEGDGDVPGTACYAGPFRIGLLGVHEHHDVVFVRGAWVQIFPSGESVPGDAADLASAPKDGGPLYAELQLAAEPGLVCRRDGPLKALEAVDEAGRPLLAPAREDARQSVQAFASIDGGIAPIVRVPLRRPEGGDASKTIQRLRGVIPVEIAALRPEPAVVIPLGEAEGKAFRGGGAVFTVETDRTEADGRRKLAFSCRLTDEGDPARRESRLAALRTYQLRVVDARGADVRFGSGSSGGDGRGTLNFSYEYTPGPQSTGPPAEFRYHDLDRAAWQIPFQFHDVPLP